MLLRSLGPVALQGFLISAALLLGRCLPCDQEQENATIDFTLIHMNDVYEMTPQGGQGGLARVAQLEKELAKIQPIFTVLAGDLVSPSAIGLAVVDGEPLAGKQMIAVMNHFLDFMTFGNHEFDIREQQLLDRLNESTFTWISSNVSRGSGAPFPGVLRDTILEIGEGDQGFKVGIFSLTLDSNKQDWVSYDTDLVRLAEQHIEQLRQRGAQMIIALTHLEAEEDLALAVAVPAIDLILGGHEHENMHFFRGKDFTPVAKADANARTVYIHHIAYDPKDKNIDIRSQLRLIDDRLEEDPETKAEVTKWETMAFDSFRKQGIEPTQTVATPDLPLDGREGSIRNKATELTRVLAQGMMAQSGAPAALFNSGSIRIDDLIPAGQTLTEYDLLRILPFGGTVAVYDIRGDVLKQALVQGNLNQGSGGYLQHGNITLDGERWMINGNPIVDDKTYRVAVNDFLASGKEAGLDFFSTQNKDITLANETGEFRDALAKGLKDRFPSR